MGFNNGMDEETIAYLNELAGRLEEIPDKFKGDIQLLISAFEENRAGLGPHTASIYSLIEKVQADTDEGANPVKKLVLKLRRVFGVRKSIRDDDIYKGRSK